MIQNAMLRRMGSSPATAAGPPGARVATNEKWNMTSSDEGGTWKGMDEEDKDVEDNEEWDEGEPDEGGEARGMSLSLDSDAALPTMKRMSMMKREVTFGTKWGSAAE